MHSNLLVIWDFDGVLCDSLFECITVTRLASYSLENPGSVFSEQALAEICSEKVVKDLYGKMRVLRPFVNKGQDYLWQYYYFDKLIKCINSQEQYQECLENIWDPEKDKLYETTFYRTREILSKLMGNNYFSILQAFDGVIKAFNYSLTNYRTYICTARNMDSIIKWLKHNSIKLPSGNIYSKDWNGEQVNSCHTKSEQAKLILKKEEIGRYDQFILIEDQVNVPAELVSEFMGMKVVHASYGYGLQSDWDQANLRNIRTKKDPSELIETFN